MSGRLYSLRGDTQGSTKAVLLSVLTAVVIGAASATGVYLWRQQKVDDLTLRTNNLTTQVEELKRAQTPAAQPASTGYMYTSAKGKQLVVYTPLKNAPVSSPLAIVGEVPGNWSFEASFPVELKDASGTVVARGTGQVLGDWMTDQLVPFSAKLSYTTAKPGLGALVLHKDNPAGLAANDDSVIIPVRL